MKRKTLKNNVVTKVVAGLLAVVVFLGSGAVTQAEAIYGTARQRLYEQ